MLASLSPGGVSQTLDLLRFQHARTTISPTGQLLVTFGLRIQCHQSYRLAFGLIQIQVLLLLHASIISPVHAWMYTHACFPTRLASICHTVSPTASRQLPDRASIELEEDVGIPPPPSHTAPSIRTHSTPALPTPPLPPSHTAPSMQDARIHSSPPPRTPSRFDPSDLEGSDCDGACFSSSAFVHVHMS